MHKSIRLFNIILAFSEFAGKPLAALDCAACVGDEDFDRMVRGLQAMADCLEASKNEELKALAVKIRSRLNMV